MGWDSFCQASHSISTENPKITRRMSLCVSIECRLLRNGVRAAGAPRSASAQAPDGQPAALPCAVLRQGFLGVFRAAGVEAAGGRQQRADQPAVAAHEYLQAPSDHPPSRPSSNRSLLIIAEEARAPYGGRTSTSTGLIRPCSSRNASRMQRLIPLRSVARAACLRVTSMPRRAVPASRGAR